MCICVTDEDEKPPVMTPEVIIVNDIHAHTCIDNRIYCPTETKPPSPYLSEHEKNEPMRRRDNVFSRLQQSLTRRKRNSSDFGEEGSQLHTFHAGHLEKKSVVSLPSSISQHQSTETMIADDPRRFFSE
ncbi:hypothetical protein X975_05254, partial [Stegodyphus mimosarum]